MAVCIWEGDVSTDPTVAGNWSTAAVPQAADDVVFDGTAQDNCTGGDITANQVASVTRTADCTITIGASASNALDIDCSGAVVDRGSGTAYWKIDNYTSWHFSGSGTCSIDGQGAANSALTIDATSATVMVGPVAATAAEVDDIDIHAGTVTIWTVQSNDASPIETLDVFGGTVDSHDAIDVISVYGGTLTHESQAITSHVNVYYGKLIYNAAANIGGTVSVYNGGEFTLDEGSGAVVIADTQLYSGATFRDKPSRGTYTLPVETRGCSLLSVTLDLGTHRQYAPTAI